MAERNNQDVMELPSTGLVSSPSSPSHHQPKNAILDRKLVQMELEKPLPDGYPERTAEELENILKDEYKKWEGVDEEIMEEREKWFVEFQDTLSNAGQLRFVCSVYFISC
jgi:hypothetical protein